MISQGYVEILKFNSYTSPYAKYKNGEGKAMIEKQDFALSMPILLNSGDVILTGIGANRIKLSNKSNNYFDYEVYSTSLTIGYLKKINEKYSVLALLIPKLGSDYHKVKSSDIMLYKYLSLKRKVTENFSIGYGIFDKPEFYGHFITPIFAIDWNVNEKVRVFGNFPDDLNIDYKLDDRNSAGFYYFSRGTTYKLSDRDTYLFDNFINFYTYYQHYLTKNIALNVKLGYALARKFEEYSEKDKIDLAIPLATFGDDRTVLNKDLKDNIIFEIRLAYRVHL